MLSTFDVFFVGAFLVALVYLYLTWNFNYWKKRGIDSDDKVSVLFGSMADSILGKSTLGEITNRLYRSFPGRKVVGFYKFREPTLLVRDPELIRKILVTDFNSFLNNDVFLDPDADPIMGNNVFVLKDDLWKKGRALITPAFTSGKIKAVYPVMQEVADDMVEFLKNHPEDLHAKSTMSRYTAEIVARCAFGINGNNFRDVAPEMQEMGKLIWEPTFSKNLRMMAFFVMPNITKLLRLKLVPDRVIEYFNGILRDVIVFRQEKNIERNDLVQYFIEIKKKTQEVNSGTLQSDILKTVYTDDDVLTGCITFFVEGYETTALTINNVLYQLALHKDIQERLREEIDEVLAEGPLTFEKLHSMSYLHSVYAESSRILPVVYDMRKICTEKYEMDVGTGKTLTVEKGTSVVIPLHAIQTDPLYWEDADEFKPERFATKEQEAAAKSKGIYMPFSDGPRMCPGSRIATTMVKLAIVKILSQLEVLPTGRTPKSITPDPNYFMIAHKGGIYLRFAERTR